MKTLDNPEEIRKLDKSSVFDSIILFPDQMEQAWQEVSKIKIPLEKFKEVKNIIVTGMGGSALGARIIDSLNFEVLDVPMEIINGYHLPAYANQGTLAIISSYSGNTEETLSCLDEAIRQKCQLFAITNGGRLAELAKDKGIPAYIFKSRYNPSGQPRLGLGYSITAQLALLSRLKFLRLTEAQITEVIHYLNQIRDNLLIDSPTEKNEAKRVASDFKEKIIVVVSGEHLIGAAHTFKNMLNENSKTFAVRFSLPELNHHLLEGLAFPKENSEVVKVMFLESEVYDEEIKKRIKVTKEVLKENKIPYGSLLLKGRTRLIQAFETVYLGSLISYYLAILNKVDPATIPWVDFFKKELEKV